MLVPAGKLRPYLGLSGISMVQRNKPIIETLVG
jgi:hypothetical protein